MTKERDLLKLALEAYDHKEEPYFERLHHAFEEIRAFLAAAPETDEPLTVSQISMMANERAKITSGSSGPVTTPCDIDPFPSEEA